MVGESEVRDAQSEKVTQSRFSKQPGRTKSDRQSVHPLAKIPADSRSGERRGLPLMALGVAHGHYCISC